MTIVNIHEAKAKLSEILRRTLAGERIFIARRNRPLVELVSVESETSQRELGWAEGLLEMSPDFDDLPPDFDDYV